MKEIIKVFKGNSIRCFSKKMNIIFQLQMYVKH